MPFVNSPSKDVFGIEALEQIRFNLRARILYDGARGDIINQYVVFCQVFTEQVKTHGYTRKAVEETIRICRDQNVLKDYLEKEEVPDVLFNAEQYERELEMYKQDLRTEAHTEGREEGRTEDIRSLMETMKLSAKQAMDALRIPLSEQSKYITML